MREKILLKDFNVLLICTSTKWSTVERRAINDSIFLRDAGCNPTLICLAGSQLDKEAEKEDIERLYFSKSKINKLLNYNLFFELKKIVNDHKFDIIHTYSLDSTWLVSLLMKKNLKIPLFFTCNENIKSFYNHYFAKWLLRRVDHIFTLSEEVKFFIEETFSISQKKVKNLGSGIEVTRNKVLKTDEVRIGCIINNLTELNRLKFIVKVFRVLKTHSKKELGNLKLHIFLGPRIYQKDRTKRVLTEIDNEFYEGDIFLYSLDTKSSELKKLNLFVSLAFDEPLNDFEVISLLNEIPVLFPRTAMRQNLISKYRWIGESYFQGDIREAKTKIEKILSNYSIYVNALKEYHTDLSDIHGLDVYAELFKENYTNNYAKRLRFISKKTNQKIDINH